MLELAVLSTTVIANLLLGLIVFLKNPKALTNKLFFFLTSTLVLWSMVNFISVHPVFFAQLWWIRLVLSCGALLNLAVFLTFLTFPSYSLSKRLVTMARLAVVFTILVVPLTLTPLVFKSLNVKNGNASPVPGPGIALFLLHTLSLLGGSIYLILKKFRSSRGAAKEQLRLVLFGIVGTFSLIILGDFILVVAFNISALVPFGPSFTVIFTSALAYAIIKHRLFDIRAAVARGLAYVLSLGVIALGYGVFGFLISSNITAEFLSTTNQRVLYVGFALVTAVLFQPTKIFFDRVTNRIFYRDAYDPQELLGRLNKIFVSNAGLETLLEETNKTVEEVLAVEYSVFLVFKTSYDPDRWIGERKLEMEVQDIERLYSLTTSLREKVILSESLDGHDELRKLLLKYDISVLARMVPSTDEKLPGIGFMALGPRKSGNLYNSRDGQVLEIVANELVIAVENALRFEEIERFNITLQQKVDDATRRLRLTNEKLKALDETKDEFISMASHQLRTPLTSVKGYVSMVVEGDAGKITPKQRALLDQAFMSSQRMVYLIADLLNVSRLRTGKFIIERAPTQLGDVISGELDQLKEAAKGREIKVVFTKPKDFPALMLDETKIRQVIMNFADNALYYTRAGGTVHINLVDKPSSIEFMVVDDGIGVPKADQHHLFTKFYRANNARKARPDGTGLGLFMAKKVVVAQGGAIIFHSQEGKGSTFGFTFPKAKILAPTTPA